MIPPFRKYFLHSLALNIALQVVETLLCPRPWFSSLSFGIETLSVEESDFLVQQEKALLADFLGYLLVSSDSGTISVGLTVSPDLIREKTPSRDT
jgi:hypothetical protein